MTQFELKIKYPNTKNYHHNLMEIKIKCLLMIKAYWNNTKSNVNGKI